MIFFSIDGKRGSATNSPCGHKHAAIPMGKWNTPYEKTIQKAKSLQQSIGLRRHLLLSSMEVFQMEIHIPCGKCPRRWQAERQKQEQKNRRPSQSREQIRIMIETLSFGLYISFLSCLTHFQDQPVFPLSSAFRFSMDIPAVRPNLSPPLICRALAFSPTTRPIPSRPLPFQRLAHFLAHSPVPGSS